MLHVVDVAVKKRLRIKL